MGSSPAGRHRRPETQRTLLSELQRLRSGPNGSVRHQEGQPRTHFPSSDKIIQTYRRSQPRRHHTECRSRDEYRRLLIATETKKGLSELELGALLQLAEGLSIAESCAESHVGPDTIKSRRRSAMRALGARNSSHAVALAYHKGILEPCQS